MFTLGNAKVCTDLLIKTVRAPKAVLFACLSAGKHKVIKVGRCDVCRDGTMGGSGTSIQSSTSLFSLCSWTSSAKNDIKPNTEEMGCKNVLVWVWTWSGPGPDRYRPSLQSQSQSQKLGQGLDRPVSGPAKMAPDWTRPNFPNTSLKDGDM